MKQQIINQVRELSKVNRVPFEVMMAIIEVETPGNGFDTKTGKLLIQFEPSWFRKHEPFAPSGAWSVNKVDVQSKEWIAFNNAFGIDKESAMKSTSIGLAQIMGFHYERLGYKTIGEMWDDFKKGEHQQILALFRFILTDSELLKAVREKNYDMIAYIYNGSKYKEMAKKWGREPYNISLEKSANKWNLKKNNMKIIYLLLTIFLMLGICSCKSKKSAIDNEKEVIKEVVKETEKQNKQEDKKTEEKGSKVTEEKATEKADKKTETKDKEGNTTIIYENYSKGSETKTIEEFERSILESMKLIIDKQNETNKELFSEISKLQEKETQLKNSLIYGGIIAAAFVFLVLVYLVIKKFKMV